MNRRFLFAALTVAAVVASVLTGLMGAVRTVPINETGNWAIADSIPIVVAWGASEEKFTYIVVGAPEPFTFDPRMWK